MTFSSSSKRIEPVILAFLILFLGMNALANAVVGFSLPVFVATVPLSAILAFFFPRAGFAAAMITTVLFERFFTLSPMIIGDIAYKLYPLDIILVAVFLSALLVFLREGKAFFHFRFSDKFLLGFFVLVTGIFLVTVFRAGDTSLAVAFSTWKNYVFYAFTVFFLGGMLRKKEDLVSFGKLFLAGTAFATIFLLIGIVRGEGLWTEYTPLSTPGTRFLAFPHAFYFSLSFIILLFSLPYWQDTASRQKRFLLSIFSVVLVCGILGSLMRHLWLGLGGAFFVALLLSPDVFGKSLLRFSGRFIFPILLLLAGAWFAFSMFPLSSMTNSAEQGFSIVRERFVSIGNGYDESFAWRGKVWESTLARFAPQPFFGIGFGASVPVELGEYRQYVEVRNMHNSWLALLIQTGVVGTALFLGFILTFISALWRKVFSDPFLRQARFVLLGLLFFQGLVFFSQPYLETNLLGFFFWVTLGVGRALIGFSEERGQEQSMIL